MTRAPVFHRPPATSAELVVFAAAPATGSSATSGAADSGSGRIRPRLLSTPSSSTSRATRLVAAADGRRRSYPIHGSLLPKGSINPVERLEWDCLRCAGGIE